MRFPFRFGISLMIGELLLAGLLWFAAPANTRWLGSTIMNTSDAAVYLSYLHQGSDGHLLLHDLYAVEPNAGRFDLVWSTLGVISRAFPPLVTQELARVLFTAFLVAAVAAAAASLTTSRRDASHATLIAFGGAGGGFLFSLWLGMHNSWTPTTYPAIDLASEFAIAPLLIAGVHMILSCALLVTALRLAWSVGDEHATRRIALAACCAGLLFLFHPYFLPLSAVYFLLTIAVKRRTIHRRSLVSHLGIFTLSVIPAAVVYIPLAFDPVFRTHHLDANILPLPPFFAVATALLPAAIALGYRLYRRIALRDCERWLVVWIGSVLLCFLLPFPWKRKFLEGVNIALVFLSLPAFFALRDTLTRGPNRFANRMTGLALLLTAWFAPIHLLATQIAWTFTPDQASYFYQPVAVFSAWSYLHDHTPPTAITTSDTHWVNLWTPAYADRVTWIAHDHETPDFARKRDLWRTLTSTTDAQTARRILLDADISDFITTSEVSAHRFSALLGHAWSPVFHDGTVTIFERKPELSSLAISCQNAARPAP